jgi:2-hydroxyglutarate dehydrogenase
VSAAYDHAVVGAGILGLAVARELRRRQPAARIVVLDRADRVAADQSGHNSGVIHAGVYYPPGSLKARLCVQGAARLYEYCQREGIEARRLGKLIIATARPELAGLHEIERRARANGVPGIRRCDPEEISALEPQATGLAALHSPGTGIVDFRSVCANLADELRRSGAELRLGWSVRSINERPRAVVIHGPEGDGIEASAVVFCAGLDADRLAVGAGAGADPRIVPFRGAYLRLVPDRRDLVRGLIYPVPDPRLPFLGVHLTPQLDGEVLVGPTALLLPSRRSLSWPGTWRMIRRWWRTGVDELHLAASRTAFARRAARYVPAITRDDLEPASIGVRAQAVGRDGRLVDDFLISGSARTVHVRNAPSPAATSALALAELIVDQLQERRQ